MRTVRRGPVEIAYDIEGSGAETVLLISGLGGPAARWGKRFPALVAEHYRVIRVDNRGTGASSKPSEAFSLEDMASDAMAVLDDLGVKRAHVVGISMGGMIAQLVALEHASRVDRLALLCTHMGGPEVVAPSAAVLAAIAPVPGMPVDEATRRAMSAIVAPEYATRADIMDGLVAVAVAQPTPLVTFMSHAAAIMQNDRSNRVASIRSPTLVVHGDVDPLVPFPNGEELARRIPGARLARLEGIGHMLMWEAPDELARVVVDFMRGD